VPAWDEAATTRRVSFTFDDARRRAPGRRRSRCRWFFALDALPDLAFPTDAPVIDGIRGGVTQQLDSPLRADYKPKSRSGPHSG
jgi:hypothetical protein